MEGMSTERRESVGFKDGKVQDTWNKSVVTMFLLVRQVKGDV